MINTLVTVADYPNDRGDKKLMYVHVRNKYYTKNDISVTVLNFKTDYDYFYEDIRVISLKTFKKEIKTKYDILICHAPNLRNHFFFLKRYESFFESILFFFHGHEVVPLNKVYPKPYSLKRINILKKLVRDFYDFIKLKVWHYYLPNISYKSEFVFVSKNFFNEFKNYVNLQSEDLHNHIHIIYNSVAEVFENESYEIKNNYKFDFITIRNNLDSSVYCIDLVYDIAKNNPDLKFLIVGRGNWLKKMNLLKNITWIDKYLNHEDMIELINQSQCALMLTRRDTQGVMSCELATFGIPLITSNIKICNEVFNDLKNVELIDINDIKNIKNIKNKLIKYRLSKKNENYFSKNTIKKEVDLIKYISSLQLGD